jgi:hypothetical protein
LRLNRQIDVTAIFSTLRERGFLPVTPGFGRIAENFLNVRLSHFDPEQRWPQSPILERVNCGCGN